jgi:putative endonuclease
VKTRSSRSDIARGRDAVDKEKRDLIRHAALCWRQYLRGKQVSYRYDIVEVLLVPGEVPELIWLRDAFQDRG